MYQKKLNKLFKIILNRGIQQGMWLKQRTMSCHNAPPATATGKPITSYREHIQGQIDGAYAFTFNVFLDQNSLFTKIDQFQIFKY